MNASSHVAADVLDFAAVRRVAIARGSATTDMQLTAAAMRLGAQYIREDFEDVTSTPVNDLAGAAALLREDAQERRTRERYEWRNGDALLALDYANAAAALSFCADYLLTPEAAAIAAAGNAQRLPSDEPSKRTSPHVYQQSDTQTKSGA